MKKLPRNARCPCGSGKKYKRCCWDKGFTWSQDEDGEIVREVPLTDEALAVLEEARADFARRHGREPGPEDKIFDDVPHPEILELEVVERMRQAGINPAIIHAFEKTGLLVSEDNMHLIADEDLAAWEAAIADYERYQADDLSQE